MRLITKIVSFFIISLIALCLGLLLGGMKAAHNTHNGGREQSLNQIPKLEVTDLPSLNVLIINSSNQSFEGLFTSLVSVPDDVKDWVKQFSVFITNNSDRAINAYTVKWEFIQPDGRVISSSKSYSHSKSFLNSASVLADSAIKPQSSRLISLIQEIVVDRYPAKLMVDQPKVPENDKAMIRQQMVVKINELNIQLSRSVGWRVVLDGVFFADGTFAGPDTTGYFDRFKARFDARQDLLQEVSRIIDQKNATQTQVFANVFKYVEEVMGATPKLSGFKAIDFYKRHKTLFAREILSRRENFGDKATIDFIKGEINKPRIEFVKQ